MSQLSLSFFFCLTFFTFSIIASTEFDFGTLTLTSLKLLGDAHLNNGTVTLTRDLTVPFSGAGQALYSRPIRFRQPGATTPASFTTFFSFSVTNLNPSSIGGGLAFVISPDDDSLGDAGGYLGLAGNGFVAVEFDTLMDVEFKDINGNHVGVDLNSVVSSKVGDLDSIGVDLKSGDSVNAWIEFDGSSNGFSVWVSYSNLKPKDPILTMNLDMGLYLNDFMYVGFSGSTQGSTEIHRVEWWSFSSSFVTGSGGSGGLPPPPAVSLMNTTANSARSPPPSMAPTANSSNEERKESKKNCHNGLCKHRRIRSDLDAHTFTPLLRPSPPSLGKQFHAQMIRTGTDSGTVPKTALLDMYSRHGSLDDSLKVFDEMLHRDVVAWNALLSCFLRCGKPHESVGVLREMGRENVEMSEFTLCSVLKCCASLKALELGRQVHGLVVAMGRDLLVLSTALIDFYSSVGCVDHALNVFYGLKGSKDDMLHNSLVSGCIKNGRYREAFKVMSSVKPNAVALTSVLVCCSEESDLLIGKQVHCLAVRRGFTFETQLCNVLLDMYAKCGKILLARSVFDGICRKDVISWTCIIDAYGRNGCGHQAIELFWKMMEDGSEVLPNSVTFLSVLSACGHSGLVEEGKQCFNIMREKYGIYPELEHYACFIDILGRAGKIEEVWSTYQNIIEQGTRPTAGVWIALLNACSLSQDFERGEFAAKNLLQLEPDKASNIVLVSNFYAAFGRWDCVEELRGMMRTKGLVKETGNSWIGEGFNRHARSLSA